MKKIKMLLILSAAMTVIFTSSALAKAPLALIYPSENKITVSGKFEEMPQNKTVNILVLNKNVDYENFTADDILYIESSIMGDDGIYGWTFDNIDYENMNIYVKADNKYIPVTTFNTVIDENITNIKSALIRVEENVITVGKRKKITITATDKNEQEMLYDACSFYGYDENIISVENSSIIGKKQGDTEIYAVVTKNGKKVKTNTIKISVRESNNQCSLTGAIFKNNSDILDITGDLSQANEVIFSFNKEIEDIKGIRITNLTENSVNFLTGVYNSEQLTYAIKLQEQMGYSKYKFEILSDSELAKSEITEGCLLDFGIPDVIAPDRDYMAKFTIYNCRGYKVEYDNLKIQGLTNGALNLSLNQETELTAEFDVNGIKHICKKKIKTAEIGEISVNLDSIRLEKGESLKIKSKVYSKDGYLLDVSPNYTVSGKAFSVNENGILSAVDEGVGKLTISLGEISKSFVIASGYDIDADNTTAGIFINLPDEFEIGEKQTPELLKETILGKKTKIENVIFTTDNNDVMVVENNILRAVNYGKACITAEYNGKKYAKTVFVVPKVKFSAQIELKSNSLPISKGDVVKVLLNSNEYLVPGEYVLVSGDENILKTDGNMIFGISSGKTTLIAKIKTGSGYITTNPVEIMVFEPSGGYFIDDIYNLEKIHSMHSHLVLNDEYGELLTKGTSDRDTYVIYKTKGDINSFVIYDHLCNPFDRDDMTFYVSEDNITYTQITDIERFEGTQVNGWVVDTVVSNTVSGNYKYLKIVMNNSGNTQATRLDRVEISYSTSPEVIDCKIIDDCNEEEIYKNILGRKAVISFDQPVNADTLSNICFSGVNVTNGVYDSDLFRYEFKLPDVSNEDYSIRVNNVTDAFGKPNRDFYIKDGKLDGTYTAQSAAVYEINSHETGKRILIKNYTVMPKTYIIIDCEYIDGKLEETRIVNEGKIDSASEKYVYVNYEKGNHKLFVWDSLQSMKPLVETGK